MGSSEPHEKEEKEIETADPEKLKGEIEKLRKALEEEKARAEGYLNQLKYLQADFDNYQKKVKKEIEEATEAQSIPLMVKLLEIVDNLERAAQYTGPSAGEGPLAEGIRMTLRDLKETLKDRGVTEIDALGKTFNPAVHEAVEQVQTDSAEDNTVVEVLRKGYLLHGKLLRPSMVKVAKAVGKAAESSQRESG
ncbi:nucleotide exchange factor GrpE [Candidatus Hecatella orcuttiae]|uniref:nucleotide exchange factor GrpE n=1 Tax=Candidatus Hecatella orcuttiae TaxID=1935119 RepID=UPI00286839F2|nr:nucleotide exchange factor GrpE [Candidatus Hecatella orcuttiae]